MRRVTWLRYNHEIKNMFLGSWLRQPMQRTEYYMPWGTVTVDELCRMESYISERQPKGDSGYAIASLVNGWD
jgi:hypothetical protein